MQGQVFLKGGGGWHFSYLVFFHGLSFLHLEMTLLFGEPYMGGLDNPLEPMP